MKQYYINYGTGAGNEYVDGNIDDAKAAADAGVAYTQCGISIFAVIDGEIAEDPECTRKWWGVKLDPTLYDDGETAGIINYGDFGYYDAWDD